MYDASVIILCCKLPLILQGMSYGHSKKIIRLILGQSFSLDLGRDLTKTVLSGPWCVKLQCWLTQPVHKHLQPAINPLVIEKLNSALCKQTLIEKAVWQNNVKSLIISISSHSGQIMISCITRRMFYNILPKMFHSLLCLSSGNYGCHSRISFQFSFEI